MTDDVTGNALLRGAGAVAVGAGALALFPPLAAAVSLTTVLMFAGAFPPGIAAIHQFGDRNRFPVAEATMSMTRNHARYEALVWLPATGDVLDAGAGTEEDWAWHGRVAGGYLVAGPDQRQATLVAEDAAGARVNPCGGLNILMRVDEPTDSITWWHPTGAGHARYTDAGSAESCSDALFTRLRLPALRVAVRVANPCHVEPARDPNLSRVELDPSVTVRQR